MSPNNIVVNSRHDHDVVEKGDDESYDGPLYGSCCLLNYCMRRPLFIVEGRIPEGSRFVAGNASYQQNKCLYSPRT